MYAHTRAHANILRGILGLSRLACLNGDMIEVFKITHNIYNPEVSPELRYYPKCNTNR